MYWKYGQKILAAAKFLAGRPNLRALYITNFRCGPDSFIGKFFERLLGRAYLTIELDQHGSDVGAVTRCEAFVDSFRNSRPAEPRQVPGKDMFFDVRRSPRPLRVYVPHMDDHGRMMVAVFRSNGIDAEALPVSDPESLELGRQFTSGKECYPCILTTGDFVKATRRPDFDPRRAAFFMAQAKGPCRFGQYHRFHRMVLDEIGLEQVPVVILDQTGGFQQHVASFGPDFYRRCWDLVVIVDCIQKMVRERRPYEVHRGETDRIYREALQELVETAERRGDCLAVAARIRQRLEAVETDCAITRPIIGVVGEIYVRSNEFANGFLVRKLEALGAQVVLPTLQEWLN
jgi:predicted nucleotide-binding protein (sugar kinase/HSP70/actin superfamily)